MGAFYNSLNITLSLKYVLLENHSALRKDLALGLILLKSMQ